MIGEGGGLLTERACTRHTSGSAEIVRNKDTSAGEGEVDIGGGGSLTTGTDEGGDEGKLGIDCT